MIFVTVGSYWKFEPLVIYMDNLSLRLNEEVIIQIGNSEYLPVNCKYFRFKNSLLPYYESANIIIAHGGAGTCFEVLKIGKKLIGIENKFAIDSHQADLLNMLNEEGYIIWCKEINELEYEIQRALNHEFKSYNSPICDIPRIINEFLSWK